MPRCGHRQTENNGPRTLAAQPPQRPEGQGQATAAGLKHGEADFCIGVGRLSALLQPRGPGEARTDSEELNLLLEPPLLQGAPARGNRPRIAQPGRQPRWDEADDNGEGGLLALAVNETAIDSFGFLRNRGQTPRQRRRELRLVAKADLAKMVEVSHAGADGQTRSMVSKTSLMESRRPVAEASAGSTHSRNEGREEPSICRPRQPEVESAGRH